MKAIVESFRSCLKVLLRRVHIILGNPGMTHSVPTAFIMNAVGTEWVTPGLPRMGMGHTWVTEDGFIQASLCNFKGSLKFK